MGQAQKSGSVTLVTGSHLQVNILYFLDAQQNSKKTKLN